MVVDIVFDLIDGVPVLCIGDISHALCLPTLLLQDF